MHFQQINRTDPDKVFSVLYNSDATAMTVGEVVCFDYTTDADGVSVVTPTTALFPAVAGIVADDVIAASAYGRVQIYGHCENAQVGGGAVDVTVGAQLIPVTGTKALAMAAVSGISAANDSALAPFVAGEAYTTTAAAAKKVLIRCM